MQSHPGNRPLRDAITPREQASQRCNHTQGTGLSEMQSHPGNRPLRDAITPREQASQRCNHTQGTGLSEMQSHPGNRPLDAIIPRELARERTGHHFGHTQATIHTDKIQGESCTLNPLTLALLESCLDGTCISPSHPSCEVAVSPLKAANNRSMHSRTSLVDRAGVVFNKKYYTTIVII